MAADSTRKINPKVLAAVDLFCGVGGTAQGFVQEGIPVVAGVDIDFTCEYAFVSNTPNTTFHCRSVADLTPSEINAWYPENSVRILIGCAPCQPFSTYSYRYREEEEGEASSVDERWGLLSVFGKLVANVLPEIVTVENVPELLSQKHHVYLEFVEQLEALGYHVSASIVRCADYGVPQTRERLVLLASLLGTIQLINPTHNMEQRVSVRSAIGHLPEISAGGPAPKHDPLHRSCSLSPLNQRRIRATPRGGGWQDWPADLRLECHKKETGKTYPSVYGRMPWDALAPTITTQCYGLGSGRFGHPEQHRAISLREAALLQTFPENYAFAPPEGPFTFRHIGRHIGNAVPVRLGAAIARSITQHLEGFSSQAPDTPDHQ